MRRLGRWAFNLFSLVSLLLCVAVCVLWVRARSGSDSAVWAYNRWLPDGSAASTQVDLTSDKRRVWLSFNWGRVGPFNGQLVWGYYINADQSGGRPHFTLQHQPYDPEETGLWIKADPDSGLSGWGPLRWYFASRSRPKDGDDSCWIGFGLSHWLLALLLLLPAMLWLKHFRKARRARRLGLCPACGYDLRATPDCCPECGYVPAAGRA